MTASDFISNNTENLLQEGSYTWSSPSNIALIKYWGKKKDQIPENPSISFTLDECKTTTKLSFSKRSTVSEGYDFEVIFEGENNEDFKPKIEIFFDRIIEYLPFLKDYSFVIETENSFPHSSGIASSASGMSALAMCLMSMEKEMNPDMTEDYFIRKGSFLARLGSGSASRSVEGDLVVWGKHETIEGSSDLFGVKYPYEVHENFKDYHDTILLVDKGEKQVSSTVGHGLMHGHPFAQRRFQQANHHLDKFRTILKTGDLKSFIEIVESEALTLHAMMMTSNPYFILMKPNTLEIINRIWTFREETEVPICFTLDAGANVHVLFPDNYASKIYDFIKTELVAYCQNGHYICDRIGFGAKQLPI